jgi:hypothetical protein
MNQNQIDQLYDTSKKSVVGAFVLAFFFGPLGMFVASGIAGIIALIVTVAIAAATGGFGAIILWPVWMIAAPWHTSDVNKKLKTQLQIIHGSTTEQTVQPTINKPPYVVNEIQQARPAPSNDNDEGAISTGTKTVLGVLVLGGILWAVAANQPSNTPPVRSVVTAEDVAKKEKRSEFIAQQVQERETGITRSIVVPVVASNDKWVSEIHSDFKTIKIKATDRGGVNADLVVGCFDNDDVNIAMYDFSNTFPATTNLVSVVVDIDGRNDSNIGAVQGNLVMIARKQMPTDMGFDVHDYTSLLQKMKRGNIMKVITVDEHENVVGGEFSLSGFTKALNQTCGI